MKAWDGESVGRLDSSSSSYSSSYSNSSSIMAWAMGEGVMNWPQRGARRNKKETAWRWCVALGLESSSSYSYSSSMNAWAMGEGGSVGD